MGDFNETDQTLHLNQKNRRGKKHTLCIQNTEDILDFMNTPTCYGNGGWHCRNYENCEEFIVAEKSGNAEVGGGGCYLT